jgi:hypothetical protein
MEVDFEAVRDTNLVHNLLTRALLSFISTEILCDEGSINCRKTLQIEELYTNNLCI